MNTMNRVLRPRKNRSAQSPPAVPSDNGASFVKTMLITVTDSEGRHTRHELTFDDDPLSLREMYSRGFLGELEFVTPDGKVENVELEAGPAGEFEGDVIGQFVFRFNNTPFCTREGMHVTKFNFTKT